MVCESLVGAVLHGFSHQCDIVVIEHGGTCIACTRIARYDRLWTHCHVCISSHFINLKNSRLYDTWPTLCFSLSPSAVWLLCWIASVEHDLIFYMQFINVHGFVPPQDSITRKLSNALFNISSKHLMKESCLLQIAQKGFKLCWCQHFAKGWNASDCEELSSVSSHTGYITMYAGCPIIWVSKLQSEVALSTTEAEFIALSQAMRDLIPLLGILEEVTNVLQLTTDCEYTGAQEAWS